MEISSYNLSWPKFTSCFTSSFKQLSENDLFSDITLICEQNKQLKAHKVILGACSTFFRNILAHLPQHPSYLYLDGMSYQDLRDAVRFMYLGEVRVEKKNLDTFMLVCKKLEILGLTGENLASINDNSTLEEVDKDDEANESPEENVKVENHDHSEELDDDENVHLDEITTNPSESENGSDAIENNLEDEEQESTNDSIINFKPVRTIRNGKPVFACDKCEYVTSGKLRLKYHIDAKHLNIRYPCSKCEYTSIQPSDLKKHKRFKHDKIRAYACEACPYKAFDKPSLLKHAISKNCPIKKGGEIEKKL